MSAGDAHGRPSMLAEVVRELELGGAARPAESARWLRPEWTEDAVRAVVAELFCDVIAGRNHEPGLWWVA